MKGGGNSSIDVSALLQEMLITMMMFIMSMINRRVTCVMMTGSNLRAGESLQTTEVLVSA